MTKTKLLLLAALLSTSMLQARSSDYMEQYFETMATGIIEALEEAEESETGSMAPAGLLGLSFTGVEFRVRPKVGFEIPGIISLFLVPQLELKFAKE